MLKLAAARLAFLKEEGGDQIGFFIGDSQLAGLGGIDDCLVNSDEVEIRKAAAQLQAMTLSQGEISRLRQPEGELFAEILKERRNALGYLGKVFTVKTLEADGLMRADKVFARVFRQNFDVAKNISAREIGVRCVPDAVADCFHHPAIDDVEGIAAIPRRVK